MMFLLFSSLYYIIKKKNPPVKTAALHLARGWYVPHVSVSFVHPGVIQPSVQGPQWSLVWGLVSSTPLSRISGHLSLCKHGLSRGNGMFASKPKPSVVSNLDGGCTWANGAFSKQCLAQPPDKGLPLKQIL